MHASTIHPCVSLEPATGPADGATGASGGQPRILWLFNCVGTPESLLYWNRLLPPLIDRFPASQFWSAFPPSKPVPGTDRKIEFAGAWHLPLGKRKNSYHRQFVIPTPTILGRIRRLQPEVIIVQELLGLAVYLAMFRPWLPRTRILALIEGDPYQGATRRPRWPIVALRRFACRGIDLFLTSNAQGALISRPCCTSPRRRFAWARFSCQIRPESATAYRRQRPPWNCRPAAAGCD